VPFTFDSGCLNAWEKLKKELISAPIISPPDWSKSFEIMCDASSFAIDAILGQCIDNKQHVIYYSSRTLNDAQMNYTTIEKEFLAVLLALEKFRSYLGPKAQFSPIILRLGTLCLRRMPQPDSFVGSSFKNSISKFRDKKGEENVIANYLSRIPNSPCIELPINDDFPDETLSYP